MPGARAWAFGVNALLGQQQGDRDGHVSQCQQQPHVAVSVRAPRRSVSKSPTSQCVQQQEAKCAVLTGMTGGTIAGIIISQQILGNKHPWSDVRTLHTTHICVLYMPSVF